MAVAQWDDIVIGYGLTGACVSRTLADAGRRVLIIERGRAVSDPAGSHLRNRAEYRNDPDGWFPAVDRYVSCLDPEAPAPALPGAYTSSIALAIRDRPSSARAPSVLPSGPGHPGGSG